MKDIYELFYMGGYGAYVWSSYLICFVILGGHLVWNKIRARSIKKQLKRLRVRDNIE